jgi:hypothetical protein
MTDSTIKSNKLRSGVADARVSEKDTSVRDAGNSLSMHADVPVWYDCCSCEAEPYWLEMMEEPRKE